MNDPARDALGTDATPPLLRVVAGAPDAEELAAVTAVLLALAAGPTTSGAAPATAGDASTTWERAARRGRLPLQPGPGAWRAFSG